MKEYTRHLKRERELRSWSQEQVAEKIGTTAPNVSRWERGKTFPDTFYRQKLCELFGKSAEELGLIEHDTDTKSKQSTNQPAVAQDSTSSVPVASSSARNQNRQRMLQKVRSFWINGVLEQSLQGAALVALGLHMQPDGVANPWNLVLQRGSQPANLLPTGTGIVQVFDNVGGELLILGEPGTGKTTLLLELARELLNRASHDATHPIPVVFNLSSWATKQQQLTDWLSEELNNKYQVPRKLARAWIGADLILPLLDGLDEVSPSSRAACVDAINSYRKEHGLVPVVVCSRSAEYFAQAKRVLLHSAVVVQPLTWQQINDYLESGGEKLKSVREALNHDPTLQELTTTPLMLSVLTLVYHDVPREILTSNSSTQRLKEVFATYVQRMLRHRGATTHYTPEQTIRWLAWLAKQLAEHNQTEFYIECMQPDWLSAQRLRKLQASRLVRLMVGLIAGLVIGVLYGLFCGIVMESLIALQVSHSSGLSGLSHWWKYIIFELYYDLSYSLPLGLIVGLVIGLIVGLICKLDTEIKPTEALVWSWTGRWRRRVAYGLIGIFIGVLSVLMSFGWLELAREMTNALSLSGTNISAEINTTGGLVAGPASALIAGFVGGLVGLIMSGWSSTMLDKKTLVKPNQGIRRSVRRGLLVGLISAFIGVLFVMIAFSVSVGEVTEFSYAPLNQETTGLLSTLSLVEGVGFVNLRLIVGLAFGIAFTLYQGGFACIKHMVLRLFLWRAGSIPWNYPDFLDYSADRLLLRKVGGGYIFVHRLLLDYFASQNTQPRPLAIPMVRIKTEPRSHNLRSK